METPCLFVHFLQHYMYTCSPNQCCSMDLVCSCILIVGINLRCVPFVTECLIVFVVLSSCTFGGKLLVLGRHWAEMRLQTTGEHFNVDCSMKTVMIGMHNC